MDNNTYFEIKRKIKSFIHPPFYGYDIEDIVQDTVLKLLEKKFCKQDCLYQCKIIAFNLFVDYYRKNRRFTNVQDASPNKQTVQHKEIEFEIPEKYKQMYIMRYKFGMKLHEISNFTGTHLSTVKKLSTEMKKEIKRINGLK